MFGTDYVPLGALGHYKTHTAQLYGVVSAFYSFVDSHEDM